MAKKRNDIVDILDRINAAEVIKELEDTIQDFNQINLILKTLSITNTTLKDDEELPPKTRNKLATFISNELRIQKTRAGIIEKKIKPLCYKLDKILPNATQTSVLQVEDKNTNDTPAKDTLAEKLLSKFDQGSDTNDSGTTH